MTQEDFFSISLTRAKENLSLALSKGAVCPCCDQFAKIYKRKLTGVICSGLIRIFRYFHQNPEQDWAHIHRLKICVNNEGALLRHWGLLTQRSGERDDGNPNNGFYRITQLGIDFVQDKVRVPKYIFTYNNSLRGFSEETIGIHEALGEKFNYRSLMGDAYQ